MPLPEAAIRQNRAQQITRLREILPADSVIDQESAMRVYECDARTMYRQMPLVVVLPETVSQVSRILGLASELNVKVVPARRWHVLVRRRAALGRRHLPTAGAKN